MSNMKYEALVNSGIVIGERVALPAALVPKDASVEIEAKKAAGYFSEEPELQKPECVVGRDLKDY
jgi:GTP cyclohydrolase II